MQLLSLSLSFFLLFKFFISGFSLPAASVTSQHPVEISSSKHKPRGHRDLPFSGQEGTQRPPGMGIKAQISQSPPLPSRSNFILPLTFQRLSHQDGRGFLPWQSPPAQLCHIWAPLAVPRGVPEF